MLKSLKQHTLDNRKILSPLDGLRFGYSPDSHDRVLPKMGRKASLIDLRTSQQPTKENFHKVRPGNPSQQLTSKKILQIIKEAQLQLSQHEKAKQPRAVTLESQQEGLNFTFAQNFSSPKKQLESASSNRKIILKEFSAQSLRKKYFA